MLAARLALLPSPLGNISRVCRTRQDILRVFSNDSRAGVSRPSHATRRKTLKEMAFSPSTKTPFSIGQVNKLQTNWT